MLEIYKNIRFFRKKRKMSQEQLAKLTGYTDRSSIAKIEKGEIDIPQSKITLFANALNIDAGTLMGDTGLDTFNSLHAKQATLVTKFESLSEEKKQTVLDYIDFLQKQEHRPGADDSDG